MREIRAEIIAIGDELLYGHIVDTNSHWISQELSLLGVKVVRKTTVGDKRLEILSAFKEAEFRADLVLITGGLGPTQDDLTKPLLAEYFNCDIIEFPEAVAAITSFFARRGREMIPSNVLQGHLPECCTYVPNEVGTAPGMWFERNQTFWMSMPGVPHEMKKLMLDFVMPKLAEVFPLPVIRHRMIKTVGIGESWLAELISDWENGLPEHIKLAYLPSLGHVKLRLTGFGENAQQIDEEIQNQMDLVLPSIEKYVYGYDDETLETAVSKLLSSRGLKVALAESCSGGFVSHQLTTVPGSSAYFQGAVIPYHNAFKTQLLDVPEETLISHGAVSEETVLAMASGVRKAFAADYGLASSGVAGPSGGSAEKPVGTVWISCVGKDYTRTKKLQLTQDRLLNIQLTSVALLNLLRISVLELSE